VEYHLPILGEFTACAAIETETWQRFIAMLKRKGKARIMVTSVLEQNGLTVGTLMGEFVALG
jgi:thioesterase domain-containing protein